MDDGELARRCEALYDRVVRDVEEARTESWHARFMAAFGNFHEFILRREEPSDIKRWLTECQSCLLDMAPLAPKLPKELLSLPDAVAEVDIDDFDTGAVDEEVYERIRRWLVANFDLARIEADEPFADRVSMLDDDLRDITESIGPAWRCWHVGSAAHMFEASCNLNIDPWHWSSHLFHAILALNVLRHYEPD